MRDGSVIKSNDGYHKKFEESYLVHPEFDALSNKAELIFQQPCLSLPFTEGNVASK